MAGKTKPYCGVYGGNHRGAAPLRRVSIDLHELLVLRNCGSELVGGLKGGPAR